VTPSIEGPLDIAHIGILFGIDPRIGKETREVTVMVSVNKQTTVGENGAHSMKNFMLKM
jgi:hypothetical protein